MLKFGRHVEQTDTIQLYYERGPLGNFRNLLKAITTLTSFGSHFGRFQVLWKEQSC